MAYEVINEDLNIKACSIGDLTMQQVQHFLRQWKEGSNIGALTLFYELDTGAVVLNRDNKDYSLYYDITESYLAISENGRKELMEKAPESLRGTLKVLENCVKYRTIGKEISIARMNFVHNADRPVLHEIAKERDVMTATILAFRYGVMQGKRAERDRRRKSA